MIKKIDIKDIAECVNVIRESFFTVANELGFTIENAPRFTAFSTTTDRLERQLIIEHAYVRYAMQLALSVFATQDNLTMERYNSV